MDEKRTDYTIIEGELKCGSFYCKIPFALVFDDNGVFYIETFLANKEFYEQTQNTGFYTLIGKTEKGYDIEITNLSFRKFQYSNFKLELICYGYIKLSDNRKDRREANNDNQNDDSIYLVELEGLKMEFAHHTSIEKYRNGGKVEEFFNFDFDHTSCAMTINFSQTEGNYYKLIFTQNPKNENIVIDFSEHKGYNRLTYKNYLQFKNTFLSFLSFINGGHVTVKKELTGWFISTSGNKYTNSQTTFIYSRKKKTVKYLSDYIPANEHHSYSSNILPHMFISCFDKYYQLNKQLDFVSLVFSLNNSTETTGLEEKYFILITALEKICSNYAKTNEQSKKTIIDTETFQNQIRPELDAVLKKYEAIIKQDNHSAWAIFKSKIGNINNINKAETSQKLYELFAYSSISLNNEVISLIETERNQAVHEGIIGKTEQDRIKNYWKLDHILRDIILNLIGYKSYRKHIFKYYEQKVN
jgi:hypothetical protein